ncbi:hypothetical protein [uncultured Pseudomonas sp.]|uniref:hypothetical protein n=1 Tax=uncultured Pseudomonas sp. TaxID=114707 RepID=UPI0025CFBAD5|nr:hypothetical protein [uncultured Pseudomonas sp.]
MKQLQLTAENGEYEATGFALHYAGYLEERDSQVQFSHVAAIVLACLGIGLVLFTGMYPLGFIPVALAILLKRANGDAPLSAEAYLKKSWFLLLPDGTQCDERLSIAWLEDDRFAIEIMTETVPHRVA